MKWPFNNKAQGTLFENKDVQFLKDAMILITAELNNLRVYNQQTGDRQKADISALSESVDRLTERVAELSEENRKAREQHENETVLKMEIL